MPDPLPDRPDRTVSAMQSAWLARVERRAELNVALHAIAEWRQSLYDQIDSQALGDALRAATDEEVDYYDEGRAKAGDSVVKQRIVADKIALFTTLNNRRITRRFGR